MGELSEFAEGGYRVLRVDTFEFGVFRQGDRVVAYENYCPHDGGPVCQGKVIPRVEEELGPDQTSRGLRFLRQAQHRLPLARLGIRHRVRSPLRRSQISPAAGRRPGARQPRLCQCARAELTPHFSLTPHAEERSQSASRSMRRTGRVPSFETRAQREPLP